MTNTASAAIIDEILTLCETLDANGYPSSTIDVINLKAQELSSPVFNEVITALAGNVIVAWDDMLKLIEVAPDSITAVINAMQLNTSKMRQLCIDGEMSTKGFIIQLAFVLPSE